MVSKMRMEVRIPCAVDVPDDPRPPMNVLEGWWAHFLGKGWQGRDCGAVTAGMIGLAALLRERGVDVVFLAPGEEE